MYCKKRFNDNEVDSEVYETWTANMMPEYLEYSRDGEKLRSLNTTTSYKPVWVKVAYLICRQSYGLLPG